MSTKTEKKLTNAFKKVVEKKSGNTHALVRECIPVASGIDIGAFPDIVQEHSAYAVLAEERVFIVGGSLYVQDGLAAYTAAGSVDITGSAVSLKIVYIVLKVFIPTYIVNSWTDGIGVCRIAFCVPRNLHLGRKALQEYFREILCQGNGCLGILGGGDGVTHVVYHVVRVGSVLRVGKSAVREHYRETDRSNLHGIRVNVRKGE